MFNPPTATSQPNGSGYGESAWGEAPEIFRVLFESTYPNSISRIYDCVVWYLDDDLMPANACLTQDRERGEALMAMTDF